MPSTPSELAERCAAIELLVLDVDGVLTDGAIVIHDDGSESKAFHVRDGWGLAAWRRAGGKSALLSGRSSKAVSRRAAELGVDAVVQGAASKAKPFRQILAELGVAADRACYMGDDLPDLPVLALAGLSACPSDAVAEVRGAVHYVATVGGGRGAVREVIEMILKHRGEWDGVVGPLRGPG